MSGRTRCIIVPNKRELAKDAGKVPSRFSDALGSRVLITCSPQLVAVPPTLDEFLKVATEKLNISAKRAFTENGVIVDDVSLIRDDERIFISTGEGFWKYDGPYLSCCLMLCLLAIDSFASHCLPHSDAKVRTYKVGTYSLLALLSRFTVLWCVSDLASCPWRWWRRKVLPIFALR